MNNYGELLAKAVNGILWSYGTYGSYSGDYIAIIEKGNELQIYKGVYGSCSGCDWLEGAGDYVEADNEDEDSKRVISQKEIDDYVENNPPFLVIPKDSLPDTPGEFMELLPANSRMWTEDNYDLKLESIYHQLKNPSFNNLEYLEAKHDQKIIDGQ